MGAHCKYCKAMGHNVANCPSKPKELHSCFLCHAVGHLQSKCTRIPPSEADPNKCQQKTVSTTTDIPKTPQLFLLRVQRKSC
ncbi:hypothetical protein BDF14DRAFT_1765024 [Spinellus fusiger]|nr:hypothetical protein BDF14DRAFT_1765013 [Spinellus fusiger]KAI7871265.1 hypothetical protein BDF14DRAFT_1765024 [Spinellus fusiger]